MSSGRRRSRRAPARRSRRPHPPAGIADPEARRPLGARVRRRHRDERKPGLGRDRLREVDRVPPPTASTPSGLGRRRDGVRDAVGHLAPLAGPRRPARLPALGSPRERTHAPSSASTLSSSPSPQRTISRRCRANSTNASATRESTIAGRAARARSRATARGPRPAPPQASRSRARALDRDHAR